MAPSCPSVADITLQLEGRATLTEMNKGLGKAKLPNTHVHSVGTDEQPYSLNSLNGLLLPCRTICPTITLALSVAWWLKATAP